jgi:hypothetical protein
MLKGATTDADPEIGPPPVFDTVKVRSAKPKAHVPEIHGAGRAHGEIGPCNGARNARAGAPIAGRVHGGHRDIVEGTGG